MKKYQEISVDVYVDIFGNNRLRLAKEINNQYVEIFSALDSNKAISFYNELIEVFDKYLEAK